MAAVGAVIAAIGAWRTEATARWQARVEQLRTGQARKENELHHMRHKQLYDWWHDMPDGPGRIRAMHWFGEWTGARDPYHGSDRAQYHQASAAVTQMTRTTGTSAFWTPSSILAASGHLLSHLRYPMKRKVQ